MKIGRLRHRIELQWNSPGQRDENGYLIPGSGGWVTEATMWGSVDSISGREFVASAAQQATVTWRIVVRHQTTISAEKRLVSGGRIFNIRAILPDNKRQQMVLMCETGITSG